MEIKYGSSEYFLLLDFRDKLRYKNYDRLDLEYLDRLRGEIDSNIAKINYKETKRIEEIKDNGREARENSVCSDSQI